MGAIKWNRTYHAMLATPARASSTCWSAIWLWIAVRLLSVTTVFVVVMTAFGATDILDRSSSRSRRPC